MRSLHSGLRRIRRHPFRLGFGVAALGLGMAGACSCLSLRAGVLGLTPWPGAGVTYRVELAKNQLFRGVTYPQFLAAAQRLGKRVDLAVWAARPVVISGGGRPESVVAGYVSGPLMQMLGVHAKLGSLLPKGSGDGAVVTQALWRDEFGSDPHAVGRSVWANGDAYRIVGVVADGEAFPLGDAIFLPLSSSHALVGAPAPFLTLYARPLAGTDRATMSELLAPVLAGRGAGRGAVALTSVTELVAGRARQLLALVTELAGLLLTAAWFNVCVVFLLERQERSREIAIRRCLGAGLVHTLSDFMTEAVITCVLATVLGWVLFRASDITRLSGIPATELGLPGWLVFATVAAVSAVLLAAACAVVYEPGSELLRLAGADTLGSGTRTAGGRMWRWVTAAESAIAVVLVAGALTFFVSSKRLAEVSPGFLANGLWTVAVDDSAAPRPLRIDLITKLAQLPAVGSITAASFGPLSGHHFSYPFTVVSASGAHDIGEIAVNLVGAGYFHVLEVPILQGRDFGSADSAGRIPACAVNDSFASRYLSGGLLQARLLIGGSEACDVIAVVGDFRADSIVRAPEPTVFLPLASYSRGPYTLVLRTRLGADLGAGVVVHAVDTVDPNLPRPTVISVAGLDSGLVARQRSWSADAVSLAGYCLLVAAVGLLAMAKASGRRLRTSIAVRVALGGIPGRIAAQISVKLLVPLLMGGCAGLLGAIAVERRLTPLLFGTPGLGSGIAALACALVLSGGALLLWAGTRHACAVDPALILRGG